jgi:hypothetical protein
MGKYSSAACDMLRWCMDNGIKAGPVAQPSKRDPTIVVYGVPPRSIPKIPKTFAGFAVRATSKKYDYQVCKQLHELLRPS